MVADPEPVKLLGVIAPQLSPVGTVSVRFTVAEKWLRAAIVVVVVDDCPESTAMGVLAAIVKSWM